MFREIGTAERTYRNDPAYEHWLYVMADSRIGSDRWNEANDHLNAIKSRYETDNSFNPDRRI